GANGPVFARIWSAVGDSLLAQGLAGDSLLFDGVPLRIGAGNTFSFFHALRFENMPANRDQLVIERNGGAISLNAVEFTSTPGAGNFLVVVRNLAGTAMSAQFTNSSPPFGTMTTPTRLYSLQGGVLPSASWNGQALPWP